MRIYFFDKILKSRASSMVFSSSDDERDLSDSSSTALLMGSKKLKHDLGVSQSLG